MANGGNVQIKQTAQQKNACVKKIRSPGLNCGGDNARSLWMKIRIKGCLIDTHIHLLLVVFSGEDLRDILLSTPLRAPKLKLHPFLDLKGGCLLPVREDPPRSRSAFPEISRFVCAVLWMSKRCLTRKLKFQLFATFSVKPRRVCCMHRSSTPTEGSVAPIGRRLSPKSNLFNTWQSVTSCFGAPAPKLLLLCPELLLLLQGAGATLQKAKLP